ncbi:MAG TPA: LuxR C-terminal-related transcriptional regulator [Anaerolineae bacterium]|nr:LuxR C-terminal-related transcriptional regulator [Anaerolineae bacterium]
MTEPLPARNLSQPAPLLATKLHVPPPRPNLVSRPRLVQQLDDGLRMGRKLSVLSAPAGYGKTTLLIEWIHGRGGLTSPLQIAWLSLDEGDNDPVRFFAYLVAALQKTDPRIGQGVEHLLGAPQPPSPETLVAELINDLAALSPGDGPPDLLLVLDDYHAIANLAIHEAIGLLLERQPAHVHLAITTRQDPPLPLSRLRGRGQVTEIREQDLRFDLDEAADFLSRSMGLDLTAGDVATLEARTEGWIAGLQMAALSMVNRDPESAARFIAGFTGRHQFILDYLTDEVLAGQPQPIQEFLLHTSILDRLCAPLCHALVGEGGDWAPQVGPAPMPNTHSAISGIQHLLETLDAANLFILPLDDERQWYRYHRLFADLLQARLQATHPTLVPELHRRAAAWHQQNGLGAQAVRHALATGDFVFAAAVIEQAISRLETWSHIHSATYLDWYRALPAEVVHPRPKLRLFAARALYATGQIQAGERAVDELEQQLEGSTSGPESAMLEARRLLDHILTDRASFSAVRGDHHQAIEIAQRVLDRLPEDDALARVRPISVLGLAHLRAGDLDEAGRAFTQVIAAMTAAPSTRAPDLQFAAVPLVCNLAEVQFLQGKLHEAFQTLERAVQMGTIDGRRTAGTGFADLVMAKIHYEWNELQVAECHVLEGLEQLRQGHIPASFGAGYTLLAHIRQALGDPQAAQEAMRQAVQIAATSSIPRLSVQASAHQARLWLAQDEDDRAARWAHDYQQLGPTSYLREFEDLTLARVLLARDDASIALDLLDRILPPAQAASRLASVLEIHALRTLALATTGDLDAALDALAQALELAAPEGYVRLFLDAGEPMARLLYHASRRGIEPAYTRDLLAAFDVDITGQVPSSVAHPPTSIVEPLTPRELDVLSLLAEGLTQPEIAERLFISKSTVKTHMRNLYGKLEVRSRREAVAAAEQLGLL